MDEIAAKVAAIERQEAAMVRELNHFASLVKETSRAVSERANSTRIEMAKLRKTVQLQQQVGKERATLENRYLQIWVSETSLSGC